MYARKSERERDAMQEYTYIYKITEEKERNADYKVYIKLNNGKILRAKIYT